MHRDVSPPDPQSRVEAAIRAHPAVDGVRLSGSRAAGTANRFSDWDFEIATREVDAVAAALPELVAPLQPLAQLWDRLARTSLYMLMLEGPVKVDLFLDREHALADPWEVEASTLRGIDDHFWDWTLWLCSKVAANRIELVDSELRKMHEHILRPMGATRSPGSLGDAVAIYRDARALCERQFGVELSRTLDREVSKALRELNVSTA